MKLVKSIWAIVAGFLVVVILSILTDLLLEKLNIFPPISQQTLYTWQMFLFALFYRTLYTGIGGYVTALLAPNKPMRHVIIGAAIGTAIGILGAVANWSKSAGNEWYPVLLVVFALPAMLFGGKLQIESK